MQHLHLEEFNLRLLGANAVRHYTEVEDFLAGCLGGRVSPLSERLLFDVVAPPATR